VIAIDVRIPIRRKTGEPLRQAGETVPNLRPTSTAWSGSKI